MCVIVDVHVANATLCDPQANDFSPVNAAIASGRLKVVYGGRLAKEYLRNNTVRKKLVSLDRAGLTERIPDGEVDAQERLLRDADSCQSDDWHIVALAQLSGARILCSYDQALQTDFTDRHLVATPRGCVYQRPEHTHLLRRGCK